MRTQNESRAVWYIALAAIVVIFSLRCFDSNIAFEPDATFLYNRCWQMRDCLAHGLYPFLYYNDAGGIGYASPIFYGQLTLWPFVLVLDAGILSFLKVYTLCCLLLNFFGFRFFAGRYSRNATLSACIYIIGMPFIFMCGSGMYAFQMGLGFSWFFLGYCVDFFRSGANPLLVTLTYFLIWQCNINSAVFAFVGCFGLFLVYYRSSRLASYIRLFSMTAMLLSYNIVNILVHTDALRLTDYKTVFSGDLSLYRVLMSMIPFGGFFMRAVGSSLWGWDLCCGFMQIGLLAVIVYHLVSYLHETSVEFRFGAITVITLSAIGYLIGTKAVWPTVYKTTDVFFQFPIRYFVYLWGMLVLVVSKVIKRNKVVCFVLVLCLVDIFVANPLSAGSTSGGVDDLLLTIGYGEYAGSDFVYSVDEWEQRRYQVFSENGIDYDWTNTYNGVSVDCSANTGNDIVTLPKLYYKGYHAFGENDKTFTVRSGYSNYCEVAIDDYQGTLYLTYDMPRSVSFFFGVQVSCLVCIVWEVPRGIIKTRRRILW